MGEEQIFSLVGSLGFPIVVALYLLTKGAAVLTGVKSSLDNVNNTLTIISTKLGSEKDERSN